MMARYSFKFGRLGAVWAMAAILAGCAAVGPDNQDNPVARKLTWFSYIKGEDIGARCVPGAPDAYRFVYNAVYVEQVRTYDIEASPVPGHVRMTARVTNKADLTTVLIDPAQPDVMSPWRANKAQTDLPIGEVTRLKRAVLGDGLASKPAPRRSVSSIEFYWAVSACIDGKFHLNAWIWPDGEFEQAAFPKLLFAWDMTGIAVNAPRKTDEFTVYGSSMESDHKFANYFKLRFDES